MLVGCGQGSSGSDAPELAFGGYALVTAAPGFVFFPPLSPAPSAPTGPIRTDLVANLEVRLERTSGSAAYDVTVATFTSSSQPRLYTRPEYDRYIVNLPASTYFTVRTSAYRLRVLYRGAEVATADVPAQIFPFLDKNPGILMGVHFRIEGIAIDRDLDGVEDVDDHCPDHADPANPVPRAEVCDGRDDDCDGLVDDGNPGGDVACTTGLVGACEGGFTACTNGGIVCVQSAQASAETCNGVDDDCDGSVDEYACVVPPATVPDLNRYNHSIWDIDFDQVGNTYLTEYISGPDRLHRIDPAGTRFTYTGASDYNLGFSATTPDGSVIVGTHAWCGTGGVVVQQGARLVTIIPTPSPCTCSTVSFGGYSVCGSVDPEWGYDGWFYAGNVPAMNVVGRFLTNGTRESLVTLPTVVVSVATLPDGGLFAAAGTNVYAIDKVLRTFTTLANLGSQITSIATAPNSGLVYAETQAREIWEINPATGDRVRRFTGLVDPAIITIGPDFRLYRVRARVDTRSTIESYGL
ncbi:putative metal-binding motif-containing protein [Myxococcota bacterium]|nr:putative metal-binding motif-containing protein [Myxococcota bacterium]